MSNAILHVQTRQLSRGMLPLSCGEGACWYTNLWFEVPAVRDTYASEVRSLRPFKPFELWTGDFCLHTSNADADFKAACSGWQSIRQHLYLVSRVQSPAQLLCELGRPWRSIPAGRYCMCLVRGSTGGACHDTGGPVERGHRVPLSLGLFWPRSFSGLKHSQHLTHTR